MSYFFRPAVSRTLRAAPYAPPTTPEFAPGY